jgi:nitrite reductase/ring-hydroxylating ferredoxin subunit
MYKAYYPVARLGDLQPGEAKQVTVDADENCVLYCLGPLEFYASCSLCPHQNEPLDQGHIEGCEVVCRRHHLRFDVRTGECTNAGGFWMQTLEVKIEDDQVLIGVWKD